jgi:hypothetical protein
MAYTLNQGYEDSRGLDRIQRGLLIGLPAIALVLTLGAWSHRHSAQNPQAGAKNIPIVSTLGLSADNPGSGGSDAGSSGITSNTSAPTGGGADLNSASSGALVSSGSAAPVNPGGGGSGAPVVGGRGGGPTGGNGGVVTITDCSLNQIATVNCRVPACSPEVTLAPGQKAILGVTGSCVVLN